MLSSEAVRLVAIEVLCPTEKAASGEALPTLAGRRVFDSKAASLQDLDPYADYTPVLALYTPESGKALRGEFSAAGDVQADAVLDIVAELAVSAKDDGGEFADAMADTDPAARLVLAALCTQVDMLLTRSQSGGVWRKLVQRIVKLEMKTFAVPEFGLRFHRVTMRYHLDIASDKFDMQAGGLPQPLAGLCEALPDQSYAKAKLLELAAHFHAEPLSPLEIIRGSTGAGSPEFAVTTT